MVDNSIHCEICGEDLDSIPESGEALCFHCYEDRLIELRVFAEWQRLSEKEREDRISWSHHNYG